MDEAEGAGSAGGGLKIRGRAAPLPLDREKRIPTSPRAGRDVRPSGDQRSSTNPSNPPSHPAAKPRSTSQSHHGRSLGVDETVRESGSASRSLLSRISGGPEDIKAARERGHGDKLLEQSNGRHVDGDSRNRGDRHRPRSSSRERSNSDRKDVTRRDDSRNRGDRPSERASSSRRDIDSRERRKDDRGGERSHRYRGYSEDEDDRNDRHKYRSRSRSRDRQSDRILERDRRRNHKRSYSDSESDSSDSETDSAEDRRRRRKEKRRREEKEDRRRRKEKKRERKSSKDKGKKTAASTATWGKFGVIGEGDMTLKGSEFRAWLIEERQLNPDTILRDKMKKEFAVFVEDYNTATLSHEKYYDLPKYQARMNLIKSGATLPIDSGSYNFAADMKAHQAKIDAKYEKPTATLSREEIMELRRIESERIEIGQRRLLGLDIPKYFGVRTEEVDRDALFNDESIPHGFQS